MVKSYKVTGSIFSPDCYFVTGGGLLWDDNSLMLESEAWNLFCKFIDVIEIKIPDLCLSRRGDKLYYNNRQLFKEDVYQFSVDFSAIPVENDVFVHIVLIDKEDYGYVITKLDGTLVGSYSRSLHGIYNKEVAKLVVMYSSLFRED